MAWQKILSVPTLKAAQAEARRWKKRADMKMPTIIVKPFKRSLQNITTGNMQL